MDLADRRPSRTARRNRAATSLLVATALLLSTFVSALSPRPAAAQASPCTAPANEIVAENCLPGNPPSEWDLDGVDSSAIEGFATDVSVDQGQTVQFKVKTPATAFRIDLYRIGSYGGLGARKVATIPNTATLKRSQPPCLTDAAVALVDCGNWAVSASWTVPITAVSGLYVARLVREDGTPGANHVPFVVRDDDGASDLLFQTSDTTWQAYNSYGGASLYTNTAFSNGVNRAYKVSYNRPFNNRSVEQKNFLFNAEYPAIRFLERNGYDLSYASGVDTDRRGAAALTTHQAFLSVGHDEYWSAQQRANVEAAREAGVDLAFFSGNEVFWKTRWESAIDGSGTPYRTLISYKETQANAKIDPAPVWTGTWRDPRFPQPGEIRRPENLLTGTLFTVQGTQGGITVPAEAGKLRFWRNTGLAALAAGTTATVGTETLGFEWDEDLDNGARPAGAVRLAAGPHDVSERLTDFGSTVAPGAATHSMTLYRHPTKNGLPTTAGALVFGAGTIQYAWGLDAVHDRGTNPTSDARLQQATVNLLADMGVQPGTLQGGLVAATATTDATAPTSAITTPAAGATVTGSVTITGTASDTGGMVGGVEVSTDGGATWQPATGTTSWRYAWYPQATGPATIRSRAVDDSGNLETPGAGVAVTVDRACPCTIWNDATTPASPDAGDANKVEVGVKFRSSVDGYVTGVRFYKGSGNTGAHVGNLWTTDGTRLASATFANETATGWQQVTFASPVPITANTTYVASYFTPSGHYAFNGGFFGSDVVTAPLRALANGVDGPNGVYVYAAQSSFPFDDGGGSNYWVDVVFNGVPPAPDTTPPVISAVQTTAVGGASATITWTTDEPADSQVEYGSSATPVSPALVTTHSVQLTGLSAGTTYTYRVRSKDAAGNPATSPTFTFATSAPGTCPCSIWNGGPVTAGQFGPGNSLELGVKFRATASGYVTGVRFYKATGDTGTHVGSLWDNATGALLASAEFGGESASGWQEVSFPAPVQVTANKTFVASYHTPLGRYVATGGYFASAVQTDVLRALADGEDGGNGVFRDGSGFPNGSFGATNYWVDAVYTQTPPPPDTTAPVISGVQAVAVDSQSATIAWTTDDASDTVVLYGPAADSYTATATAPALTRTHSLRLTGLTPNATYHFRAKSTNSAGLSSTSDDLFFSTLPVQPCTSCSLWNNDTAPAVPYLTSPQPAAVPIEVGLKFRSSVAGKILGVRFYKGALNTGTHVGRLWTAGGQLLAAATFVNESATGWQQVLFPQFVDIQPNTVYVASYTSPARAYAYTLNYFDLAYRNGPLEALSSLESPNGVYGDGAGGFPTQDGNRTNFWADVVFSDQNVAPQGDGMPPRVIGRSPAAAATDAGLASVSATFSEPVQAASVKFELRDAANTVVPGGLAYDEDTRTATFTPNTPLTPGARYTAQVLAADDLENPAMPLEPLDPGNEPWTFTTGVCPCDFFGAGAPSPVSFVGAGSPIELGLKFRSDVDGYLTGLRFYQGPDNTGPHAGHLWELGSATSGTLVASTNGSVEVPPPGPPGWKTLVFAPAVPIRGGKVYVASYSTQSGGYAYTNGYFAQSRRNGPIEALANGGVYGGNGVFGGSGTFPFSSSEATNYWVDAEFSFTAAPPNVPPSNLVLTRSATAVDEGGVLTLSGGFADPNAADTHAVTITWGDGTSSTLDLAAGALSFSATHPYADDNPTGTSSDVEAIGVTVTDPAGGSATASINVTVNNVAPTATIGGGPSGATDTVPEGALVNLGAAVTDPGTADVLTYAWTVTKNGAPYGAAGSGSVFSFTPDDNGAYAVTLKVTDDDGGVGTQTKTIRVGNVAPKAAITGAPATSPEGAAIALGSTATDPSSVDAASLTRSWSVTKNGTAFASGAGASFSFTPDDNGAYAVTLTVTDKDGGAGTAAVSIAVTNVAPTVAIAGPPVGAIYAVGTGVTFTGTYSDAGTADTHTTQWTFTAGTATLTSPSQGVKGGTVSTSYKFATAGVYNVTLAVTDDDGGTGTATMIGGQTAYVVVYDPSGGFVLGSGWFNSPAGAYRPDPTAAGRATFGFVSKYQKGLSVPTGQTDFKFQAGNLTFKSTSYDWLVIQPGFKAQYQGKGTINGAGSYAFLLTAVDGNVQGAPGSDSLRMRIWDLRTLDVVYDNGFIRNGPETTAIAGGSIQIQSK